MFKNLVARKKARRILKERGMLSLNWSLRGVKENRFKPNDVEGGLNRVGEFFFFAELGAEEYMDIYSRIEEILNSESICMELSMRNLISYFSLKFLKLAAKK